MEWEWLGELRRESVIVPLFLSKGLIIMNKGIGGEGTHQEGHSYFKKLFTH